MAPLTFPHRLLQAQDVAGTEVRHSCSSRLLPGRGANAEDPLDAPERIRYDRVRFMAQVMASLPARAVHATMDEAATAAESLRCLQLAVSRALRCLRTSFNEASGIDQAYWLCSMT